jgi:aspartate ammonia-lyase
VHTARAVENFPISGTRISAMPDLIRALGYVKKATAHQPRTGRARRQTGRRHHGRLRRLIAGKYHEQFVVDVIQGGAGTSTNMNANEVIANLALEKLGHEKGRYDVLHPNDHVNASPEHQRRLPHRGEAGTCGSPSRAALPWRILRAGFEAKAMEFKDRPENRPHPAAGRRAHDPGPGIRHLRGDDRRGRGPPARGARADPGNQPGRHRHRHRHQRAAGYAEAACRHLAEITGVPLVKAANLIEATQDVGAFVQLSGVLKRVATKLSKICNDLRLLSSGPQAGFGDINGCRRARPDRPSCPARSTR